MTRNRKSVCAEWIRSRLTARNAKGFTLIELLVVVAIIALLISILLPSLASAREGARAAVCLSNTKQFGHAVLMYTADNRTSLPGPVHSPIYHDTSRLYSDEHMNEPPTSLSYSVNMPSFIEKYLGDKSNRAKLVDKVGTCPTSDRIPKAKSDVPSLPTVYRIPSGHYVANTGGSGYGDGSGGPVCTPRSTTITDHHPYYVTDPPNYFGWTNAPLSVSTLKSWAGDPNATQLNNRQMWEARRYNLPKKLDAVRKQSDEWMIADLWYWEAGALSGSYPVGTWVFPKNGTAASSIYYNPSGTPGSGLKVPSYPYHNTTKSFRPNVEQKDTGDSVMGTPRLTTGKTNAVFFDGHSNGVRIWKGSVNPKFTRDTPPS
jgi:prepilin-type N-terminal cleavage/methylation domain-containing protein/prepilin-type processing-associated H-X9-DG protein